MPTVEDILGPRPSAAPSQYISPEQVLGSRPQSNQIDTTYDPSKGMGFLESAMVGAGREFEKLGHGAQGLYARAVGNQKLLSDLEARESEAERLMQPLRSRQGSAVGIGESLPYAATIPLSGLGYALGLGAGYGALESGVSGNPLTSGLISGGLAGAGYGIGSAIGKIPWLFKPAGYLRNMETSLGDAAQIANKGQALGYKMTPAQKTGLPGLERLEASLRSNPVTAGQFAKVDSANEALTNSIVRKELGLTPSPKAIMPKTLGDAEKSIGKRFEAALKNQTVKLGDDAFLSDLAKIETDELDVITKNPAVKKYIDRMLELADKGTISGKQYQVITSGIKKRIRQWGKPDSGKADEAEVLVKMLDVLDSAAERSVPESNRALLRTARQQWKNLISIEKPGVISGKGQVSLPTLRNKLRSQTAFRRGKTQSDLEAAAQFGSAFKPAVGESGTAPRLGSAIQTSAGLGGAALGGIAGGPLGAAVGAAAPYLSQKALGRAYLKGLFPGGDVLPQIGARIPGLTGLGY